MTDEELNKIVMSYIELPSDAHRKVAMPVFVEALSGENDLLYEEWKRESSVRKRKQFYLGIKSRLVRILPWVKKSRGNTESVIGVTGITGPRWMTGLEEPSGEMGEEKS
jgi:hypothetical protein